MNRDDQTPDFVTCPRCGNQMKFWHYAHWNGRPRYHCTNNRCRHDQTF